MSETEKKDVEMLVTVYQDLPPYLQGMVDGFAMCTKENRRAQEEAQTEDGRKAGKE